MNKIILTIIILLTSNLYSFSQTIIPLAGFQGEIIGSPTESNDTITALLLINDFSNNFTGLDLSDTMNIVLWKNCQRYEVTEFVSLFANQVTLKLYKGGNNTLHRGFCALLQENESLISHLISGITDSDKQCIDSYYRNIVSSGGVQLTEAEVDAYADNNGYLETEVDGSITNEIQDTSNIDGLLEFVQNYGIDGVGTDTSGTYHISIDNDLDSTNELQGFDVHTFGLDNKLKLSLSDNTTTHFIDLSSLDDDGTDEQDLTLTGNTLAISNDPNT
ncbi:MAG TPA: hypothetical protein DCW83_06360, partial [Saprospirales bacterium]|nr:hypothetical protein [Saprospirales bacterium]